jgi:hypothetical protein
MWPVNWDNFVASGQQAVTALLPLPQWVQHAAFAFVIICLAMLFRRSAVCRVIAAVALLVAGVMLMEIVPPLSLEKTLESFGVASGVSAQALLQRLMLTQRQAIEIALLSVGSAWILDEFRSVLERRRLAKSTAKWA